MHEIRDALNQEPVLGRSHFKDRIEAMTQRQTRLLIPGRPRVEEEGGEYYIDQDISEKSSLTPVIPYPVRVGNLYGRHGRAPAPSGYELIIVLN